MPKVMLPMSVLSGQAVTEDWMKKSGNKRIIGNYNRPNAGEKGYQ
jgi:hypothetical protein